MSRPPDHKFQKAVEYILLHPEQSKKEQAAALGVSHGTIASARAELIIQGRLTPSRKTPPTGAFAKPKKKSAENGMVATGLPAPTPAKAPGLAGLLDHDALTTMAAAMDEVLAGLDDEEIQRKILKQCAYFALAPGLHPDTKMSASQMWQKLRDQVRARDLGPSAPMDFEEATARMGDMMLTAGPRVTMAGLQVAHRDPEFASRFGVAIADPQTEAPTEGGPVGEAGDEEAPAGGTPPAPGPA